MESKEHHKLLWNDWLKIASEYYNDNGNLLVNINYKTEQGDCLGKWISHQRENYRNHKLDPMQIEQLKDCHMAWEVFGAAWEKQYQSAKEHYQKYHSLEISASSKNLEKKQLRTWIRNQKTKYQKGLLKPEQIKN